MKIKLTTVDEVKDFCNLACKLESDIFLKSDRYIIDGKSIMGIFSLSLEKELDMEIVDRDDKEIDNFLEKLKELKILKE